jgi:hypothetical protein
VSPSRLDAAYGRSPSVAARRVGGDYVLVPLAGSGADLDSVVSLNPVGAFIWEQLDGARSGNDVVGALVERFEVGRREAEADYLDFLTRLRGLEAVVAVG